jgi:hypothetical protein
MILYGISFNSFEKMKGGKIGKSWLKIPLSNHRFHVPINRMALKECHAKFWC